MKDSSTPELFGVAFPFRIARKAQGGGVAIATGATKVEQNLKQLLLTRLSERVMLRSYGTGVHTHIQDPNDAALRALVEHEILEALAAFMPEVELTAPIRVLARDSTLFVNIDYLADPSGLVRRLALEVPQPG